MRGRSTFARLMRHTLPYRGKLAAAFAAAIVVAVTLPSVPLFVRAAIDRLDRTGGSLADLWTIIVAMLAVGAVKALAHGYRRQTAGEVAVCTEADIREHLYDHVQALDFGYHERMSVGQIMSRASSDVNAIRQYLMTVPWSLTLVLQVLVIFGVMFWMDVGLAALFALTSPLLAVYTYRFASRFDPVVYRMQQHLGDYAGVVEETVSGIRVVKAFGREDHQVAKLEAEADNVYDAAMESITLRARFIPLFNLIPHLGLVAVLWYGGRQVVAGTMSTGTVVAFFSYLFMVVWPLRSLGMIVAWAQRATTAASRVFEVLDTEPGIADRPGAVDLDAPHGTIRYEGVRFAYPGGGPVLDGVDLEVPGGTSIALVGPTGCGKSTLIRLLPRFVEPDAGRLLVDGQDVSTVTLASLRAHIGIVFEDTLLFSDSIANNISFGRPDASEEEIVRAAAIARAHEFIEEMPEGYRTTVGEHGYSLSGGQRQRIAIARAVLRAPRVLILDDATSSVDARMEAEIRAGLEKAMAGRTTLIVARRPSTAALADRVAYMEAGRIVAVGTHDELWATHVPYRQTLLSGLQDAGVEGLTPRPHEGAAS